MPPEICPNCGTELSPTVKACRECGSCAETGWSAHAANDLDLPDKEFNYQDFVEKEFGEKVPKPRGIKWFWWVIALMLLVLFAAGFIFH